MNKVKLTYTIIILAFIASGCMREEIIETPDARLSISCGFSNTRVQHSEEGGYFKSAWTKGDTITVVINDETRYYVADGDGPSTTFSLSDEHENGFSSFEGAPAYAITGRVIVKDGCYALLKGDMGHQEFKSGCVPLDYQTSQSTVFQSSVSFAFSYPHSYMKMMVPKKQIDAADGCLFMRVDGDYPFYLSNNSSEWVSDVILTSSISNPQQMPALGEDSWASQSRSYPHLIFNLRGCRFLSYYASGENLFNYDNCLTYSFPSGLTDGMGDNDVVSFYVAFSPNIRLVPFDEDRYMISVYSDKDQNEKLYEKIVPIGRINTNTIYEVNLVEPYFSTDYSKDGECITLQTATIGKGIDLVFFGEGYTDIEMGSGGLYEQDMSEAVESLFSHSPLSSFKNRFNIYCVKVVSPYHNAVEEAHPLNQLETLVEYYNKIPSRQGSVFRAVVLQRFASDFSKNAEGGNEGESSFCINYLDGSFIVRMRHRATYQNTLFHEFCHGIAKLADEYEYFDGLHDMIPEDEKNELASLHDIGWRLNVDVTDNPDEVIWSKFLKDERFSQEGFGYYVNNPDIINEGLGIFEGGNYYVHGVFRPSYYSVMNNNSNQDWLNAPSREAMYKHIMTLSEGEEWEYDYEGFIDFDEPYRAMIKQIRDQVISYSAPAPIKHHAPYYGGEDLEHSLIRSLNLN